MDLGIKKRAIVLRKKGYTYSLIIKKLGSKIPKSSLSYWFKDVNLSKKALAKNKNLANKLWRHSREIAIISNKIKRQNYLSSIKDEYKNLVHQVKEKETAIIALAMIYLGEGSKSNRGILTIGNSDPNVIKLFLYLLKKCYSLDKRKFRGTVQCRADQDILKLEKFWSKLTKIPLSQFYKTRIDQRTIGKPSKKLDYKGVFRLEYFSADIYNRLMIVAELLIRACSLGEKR